MNRRQLALRYGVAAALGLVAGLALNQTYVRYRLHRLLPKRPAMVRPMIRRHMIRELRLTPDQQATIEPILDRHFQDIEARRTEFQSDIRTVFTQMTAEITPHLSPGQQAELERLLSRARHWSPALRTPPRHSADRAPGIPGLERRRPAPASPP